jgi:hypothetical protein
MNHTRGILGAAAAIAVLATLSACGDETSTPTSSTPDSTTTTTADGSASGTVEVELSEEFCAGLAQENPPNDWADAAPAELREGVAAVVTFVETLSSQEANPNVATELADTLGADGVAGQIRTLATAAGEQCDASGEAVAILPQVATAATFASGESDQAYCDALRTEFADPSEQPAVESLIDLAPSEQREALRELGASVGAGSDGPGPAGNLGALLGLGLYAEARCDIEGAFGMMFLGAAFAGTSSSGGQETAGNRPDPADAAPANAAVPAGVNLTFAVREVALTDESDTYLASIVSPAGWKDDENASDGFEASGSDGPSGQFGMFDEMAFRAGCDGTCEPKDWANELGPITERFVGYTITAERTVDGSDGRVLTLQGGSGGVTGLVQRWDDGAARYFECQVDLDEENASALPAFLAACEASRPGWITVN